MNTRHRPVLLASLPGRMILSGTHIGGAGALNIVAQ